MSVKNVDFMRNKAKSGGEPRLEFGILCSIKLQFQERRVGDV